MRGKAACATPTDRITGITPAYAGKSEIVLIENNSSEDHPRLCGEKAVQRGDITGMSGSPPPMRGKAFRKICNNLFNRITPAYAGKSSTEDRLIVFYKDHPRLCGEKLKTAVKDGVYTGSPPPMRGKAHGCHFFPPLFRITPAYAGKSFLYSSVIFLVQDHPRLCGEKRLLLVSSLLHTGSPPPMRGKAAGLSVSPTRTGITPAYAGKRLQTDCL